MVRIRPVTIRSIGGRLLTSTETTPQELASRFVPDYDRKLFLETDIPWDPQEFYKDFGYFDHDYLRDENGMPLPVKKLTWYQEQFAKMDYGVALKGNKVGMTSSELITDFKTRLLPGKAGCTCLVGAAKLEIANELVMNLKTWINNSPKYSKYLVKRPDFEEFKEEKSKVGTIVVRNPFDQKKKSYIRAIGNSLSSVYSRMKVDRVHITDPSLLKILNQDDYFAGVFSRLANTGGQIKIEGVPLTKVGWFWKICKVLFGLTDNFEDSKTQVEKYLEAKDDYEIPPEIVNVFGKIFVTIDDAVECGVIPAKQREFFRNTMSKAKYDQTFMGKFLDPEGQAFGGSFEVGDHEVESW